MVRGVSRVEIAIVQLAVMLVAGCASEPGQAARYDDPFAYCAAVGNVDAPDARYAGPVMPVAIAEGLRRAFRAPADAPLEMFTRSSFWRCMDGKVYACSVGANLPCQARADTDRTPSQPIVE